MKILSILFLVVLLALSIGCNEDDSVRASNDSSIEDRLSELEGRMEAIEEKVSGGLNVNPWAAPQSFEARLTALEEKLGVYENPWEQPVNPWANP